MCGCIYCARGANCWSALIRLLLLLLPWHVHQWSWLCIGNAWQLVNCLCMCPALWLQQQACPAKVKHTVEHMGVQGYASLFRPGQSAAAVYKVLHISYLLCCVDIASTPCLADDEQQACCRLDRSATMSRQPGCYIISLLCQPAMCTSMQMQYGTHICVCPSCGCHTGCHSCRAHALSFFHACLQCTCVFRHGATFMLHAYAYMRDHQKKLPICSCAAAIGVR